MYDCEGCGQLANSELESCPVCGLLRFWRPHQPRRFSKCHSCGQVLVWSDVPEQCPNLACKQLHPLRPRYGQLTPREKAVVFLQRNYPWLFPVSVWSVVAVLAVPPIKNDFGRLEAVLVLAFAAGASIMFLNWLDDAARVCVRTVRKLFR